MPRVFNFSAGPAVLPEPVLRKAQEAIWNVAGSGIGTFSDRLRDGVVPSRACDVGNNCRLGVQETSRRRGDRAVCTVVACGPSGADSERSAHKQN